MALPTTLKRRLVKELAQAPLERATAALPATAAGALFTVSGGRIKVHAIIGEVTVVIQTQACNASIQVNPTTGPTTALCAVNNISADAVGTRYGITGVIANAMLAGGHSNMCQNPPIVAVGDIELLTAATNTGSVRWTLIWSKVDFGASVVAA